MCVMPTTSIKMLPRNKHCMSEYTNDDDDGDDDDDDDDSQEVLSGSRDMTKPTNQYGIDLQYTIV